MNGFKYKLAKEQTLKIQNAGYSRAAMHMASSRLNTNKDLSTLLSHFTVPSVLQKLTNNWNRHYYPYVNLINAIIAKGHV